MNAKWEFLRQERQEILKVVELIEEVLPREALSPLEVIALGTLLQNVYMGIERVFRCLLLTKGIRIEKTENWHHALLLRALNEEFLNETEFVGFKKLLKFRHVHMHGYGHMLDEAQLRELAKPVPSLVRDYFDAHKAFFEQD